MKVSLQGQRLKADPELRQYVSRRLQFALSRFGSRLSHVRVSLSERNEQRRREQVCQIVAEWGPLRRVVVQGPGPDSYKAVDYAVNRLRRALAHVLANEHPPSLRLSSVPRIPSSLVFRRQGRVASVERPARPCCRSDPAPLQTVSALRGQ